MRDTYDEYWFTSRSVVDADTGCWVWQGAISNGYGWMGRKDYRGGVHRWAYLCLVGEIPEGLHLDHLCRNRACCNPGHLEAVDGRTNILRGVAPSAVNATKTHCPEGHPYTPENTRPNRKGRECRTCYRLWRRHQYRRDQAKLGRTIVPRLADDEVRADAHDFLTGGDVTG